MIMKPFDVKSNIFIDFDVEQTIDAYPKLKVGNHIRISKCKDIFTNNFIPNWSEEFLWLKKLKIL